MGATANIPLHMREALAAATAQAGGAKSSEFGAHVTGVGVGPQQGRAIEAPMYGIKSMETHAPEDLVERDAKAAGLEGAGDQQMMMLQMQQQQDAAAAASIG
eukprot:COSAG05_NODE_18571_length_306_cov_0.990338_1_plen_101_part_11